MSEHALGDMKLLGKYQLRSVIGRGAMGTVYEAWDPVIDRRVAIKTIKLPTAQDDALAEEVERFRREAKAAGRLSHPNIVAVYDYGETDELAYIVMEFVDGLSVKGMIDTGDRFTPAAIVRLMEDLLAGLEYSHQAGIIHRDIKPANIMLTKEGRAKIADFGIARIESSSMTQAGAVLGTPAYMSPEQLRGEPVDLRTDIYSTAVLLYELLTGERPFVGNLSSIMHKVLTIAPPAPSLLSTTAPKPLDAVVTRGMAKRPEERYDSASSFMQAIRAAMAPPAPTAVISAPAFAEGSDMTVIGRPEAAPAAPPPPAPAIMPLNAPAPPRAGSFRVKLLLGGAIAIAVAAVAGAFLLTFLRPSPDRPAVIAATLSPPVDLPPLPPPRQVASAPFTAPAQPDANASATAPASDKPAQVAAPPTLALNTERGLRPIASAANLSQQINVALKSLTCSAVTGDMSDRGVAVLRGFIAPTELPALRTLVTSAGAASVDDNQVSAADPSYCDVLFAIRLIVPDFGASTAHITLRDASDSDRLVAGDYIRPRVQMPDYPAALLVDYYAHDGTVEHIFPRSGEPPIKPPADPTRLFDPHELVSLGDPGPHRAVFQVGEPYGRDMIVAIASSQPLFRLARPHTGEPSSSYALDLRGAIERALSHGVSLSAAVIRMDTVAR